MRPAGEVRKALEKAAEELVAEASAATWRDLAQRAKVGFTVARRTVENMERAGVLEKVGAEKRAHSKRWMTLYSLPGSGAEQLTPTPQIDVVMRSWSRP